MQCAHEICTCETPEEAPFCDPACRDQGDAKACACGHDTCENAVIEPDLPVDVEAFDPHTLGEAVKAPFVTPKADPPAPA